MYSNNNDARFLERRITEREQAVANLSQERQRIRELPFLDRMKLGNLGMRLWIHNSINRQEDTLRELHRQLGELS